METKAGTLTTQEYDDGIAKGINILLNDEIIVSIDIMEDSGEVRALIYKPDKEEPDFITVEV